MNDSKNNENNPLSYYPEALHFDTKSQSFSYEKNSDKTETPPEPNLNEQKTNSSSSTQNSPFDSIFSMLGQNQSPFSNPLFSMLSKNMANQENSNPIAGILSQLTNKQNSKQSSDSIAKTLDNAIIEEL